MQNIWLCTLYHTQSHTHKKKQKNSNEVWEQTDKLSKCCKTVNWRTACIHQKKCTQIINKQSNLICYLRELLPHGKVRESKRKRRNEDPGLQSKETSKHPLNLSKNQKKSKCFVHTLRLPHLDFVMSESLPTIGCTIASQICPIKSTFPT